MKITSANRKPLATKNPYFSVIHIPTPDSCFLFCILPMPTTKYWLTINICATSLKLYVVGLPVYIPSALPRSDSFPKESKGFILFLKIEQK